MLRKLKINQRLHVNKFNPKDEANHHLRFIIALANLRARNYSIPEGDDLKISIIAANIMPALPTTTAMTVGSLGLEMIKTLLRKPYEKMNKIWVDFQI